MRTCRSPRRSRRRRRESRSRTRRRSGCSTRSRRGPGVEPSGSGRSRRAYGALGAARAFLGVLAERVARGVRRHGELAERDRAVGRAGDVDRAVGEHDVLGIDLQDAGGQRRPPGGGPPRAALSTALPATTAVRARTCPTPNPRRRVSPVVTLDALDRDAELVGGDLGEDRLVALALARPARSRPMTVPSGSIDDRRALVRADAGALDVAPKPEPDRPALGARRGDLDLESVESSCVQQRVEARRVVARVVDGRAAVLERDADVVGELVRLDEVAAADLRASRGPSSRARRSITRSITNAACGRPAPRYGEVGTVFVNTRREARSGSCPAGTGPGSCAAVMIGMISPYGQ